MSPVKSRCIFFFLFIMISRSEFFQFIVFCSLHYSYSRSSTPKIENLKYTNSHPNDLQTTLSSSRYSFQIEMYIFILYTNIYIYRFIFILLSSSLFNLQNRVRDDIYALFSIDPPLLCSLVLLVMSPFMRLVMVFSFQNKTQQSPGYVIYAEYSFSSLCYSQNGVMNEPCLFCKYTGSIMRAITDEEDPSKTLAYAHMNCILYVYDRREERVFQTKLLSFLPVPLSQPLAVKGIQVAFKDSTIKRCSLCKHQNGGMTVKVYSFSLLFDGRSAVIPLVNHCSMSPVLVVITAIC